MTTLESKMPDTSQLKNASVPILWVLGGPGSGKGTQCDKIVEKYGFTHISTGDLLRNEVASGSERGKTLEAIMKEGQLVPNAVVMELLAEKMLAEVSQSKGYLIDGYPRELDQGIQFEKDIGECKLVLYFECKDDTLVKRLLHRAQTSGREDDNEETIKKRLNTFHTHNDPIVKQFATKTKTLDAERDPETIFSDVVSAIDAIMADKPTTPDGPPLESTEDATKDTEISEAPTVATESPLAQDEAPVATDAPEEAADVTEAAKDNEDSLETQKEAADDTKTQKEAADDTETQKEAPEPSKDASAEPTAAPDGTDPSVEARTRTKAFRVTESVTQSGTKTCKTLHVSPSDKQKDC